MCLNARFRDLIVVDYFSGFGFGVFVCPKCQPGFVGVPFGFASPESGPMVVPKGDGVAVGVPVEWKVGVAS